MLHLGTLFTAEGRIGNNDIVSVTLLYICKIFGQGVGMHNVWCFNTMQNHVHDADDVGQPFLFLAVEGAFLKRLHVSCRQVLPCLQILIGFGKKAC